MAARKKSADVKALKAELDLTKRQRDGIDVACRQLLERVQRLESDLQRERTSRVSAQRGLVPYVKAIQRFNELVAGQPEVRELLKRVGLLDVKVGYDPNTDSSIPPASEPDWFDRLVG